ncbi:family 2 glycosyl transferase [Anabaenopsis circularis NIES-21]|uniref:Family 2 glycosyl transferase n=2 Tax=Nostocales TaxID=1161 RepID=A0A1Z4GKE5_9CYAN|nr:glycosyltransferase family 2 protein [Nostoc cycadae]BAY17980.1 family 2 glycosyl transferase [Anabaenopsis circularis NIES-21]GBE92979.1 glycosyltransferase [Nostoc cycadae WK-1]
MKKLLTIAIPTFNRAEFLDQQLNWVAKAIKGYESECEIIISDNCSTDNTQEIIKKWELILSPISFKNNRNIENIGVMRNIAYCFQASTTQYVWVIGDDDPIEERALSYVINNLKQFSDLALLILNFSWFYVKTNQLIPEPCFTVENEDVKSDGKAVIEKCLQGNFAGLAFMTAQIYRTQAVQEAINQWSYSVNNREAQVYWTSFCATQGSVKITKDVYLKYACGMNSAPDEKLWFRMRYLDLPTVYIKLKEIGYQQNFCGNLIKKHFAENNWKVILGALKRWPVMTLNIIIPYFILVGVCHWQTR